MSELLHLLQQFFITKFIFIEFVSIIFLDRFLSVLLIEHFSSSVPSKLLCKHPLHTFCFSLGGQFHSLSTFFFTDRDSFVVRSDLCVWLSSFFFISAFSISLKLAGVRACELATPTYLHIGVYMKSFILSQCYTVLLRSSVFTIRPFKDLIIMHKYYNW